MASYLGWWTDAGITVPVQDAPCNWLQPSSVANDVSAPQPPEIRQIAPEIATSPVAAPEHANLAHTDLPTEIGAFDAWLKDHPALPGADWSPDRIAPIGPAEAPIMVISDMPDPTDFMAGHLLSGEIGALFDAMLSAIGRDRAQLRIGSIALTRPPGGRWDDVSAHALRGIALHHIKIARPRHILLLGQLTCQLLTGKDVAADGEGLRNINHYGVTTATTAIHHPRLLLTRPALKRGAWTALKMLREPA